MMSKFTGIMKRMMKICEAGEDYESIIRVPLNDRDSRIVVTI